MKLTLRARLIGFFFVPIVIWSAITTIVGLHLMSKGVVNEAQVQNEVRHDLSSAREIYQEEMRHTRDAVRYTAIRFFIREALSHDEWPRAKTELQRLRDREGLDVLTLTDANGTVVLRTGGSGRTGDSQAGHPLVGRALGEKDVIASTEIIPREELLKEGADLASRARMAIVPTPRAHPATKAEETNGMMLVAAAPVLDANGHLLGALYGGKLLNGRSALTDRVEASVYGAERYDGQPVGAVSVFQGGVRIATSIRTGGEDRAVGTGISREVYDRVLTGRGPWVERTFVVDDWFIAAYEPLSNAAGEVVGMLGIGVRERRFADMRTNALMAFTGVSLAAIVVTTLICVLLASRLTRPVNALVGAAQRLAAGNLHQRVAPDPATHEIGHLGEAFNKMAESIEERDERLHQQAEARIERSERLAMIGRLAAGVSHEINNPLGSILLFSRLLLRKAPNDSVERENLERIAKEADRCKNIVRGLLEFSRQREPKTERLDVNQVLRKPVDLVANQAIFHNIEIVEDLQGGMPAILADASQLHQVFVNMLVNAAEAMDGRGRLTLTTRATDDRVEVRFTDTGCGIPPENLEHLFEPFFSTKDVGKGTGLGLSISYGIVQRHGGDLSVRSRPGEGSTFIISLPTADAVVAAAEGPGQ